MNHSIDWLSAIFPSTVMIAIALFLLRECLEWRRRRATRRRQMQAFKKLLAR